MKAVVLETHGGFAAVLRDDGVVEKIRRSCQVGETVELEERKVVTFPKRIGRWSVAAAAALILLTSGGLYGYNNAYAYSYVTLDINPSIEYVLNRKNEILRVTAINDDAQAIVESVNEGRHKGESLTDALGETTERLYEEAYLGEDCDNYILINVASHGDRQAQSLIEELGEYYSEFDSDLTVVVTEATTREVRQAQKLGVSTGRYKVAEDIIGREGGAITQAEADWFGNMPVRALLEEPIRPDGLVPPPPMGEASMEPGGQQAENSPPPKPEGDDFGAQQGENAPPPKPESGAAAAQGENPASQKQDSNTVPSKSESDNTAAPQGESTPPAKPDGSVEPAQQQTGAAAAAPVGTPPAIPQQGGTSGSQTGGSPDPAQNGNPAGQSGMGTEPAGGPSSM